MRVAQHFKTELMLLFKPQVPLYCRWVNQFHYLDKLFDYLFKTPQFYLPQSDIILRNQNCFNELLLNLIKFQVILVHMT